jgi:RES domain-containing protein
VHAWRLTQKKFASTAFSGIGNRKFGSRWVPVGELAVYTSENASTAVLETLVHMEPAHFKNNHVLIQIDIPDDISMDEVQLEDLPADWKTLYEDADLQQVGKNWIDVGTSAVLIVPSAVGFGERNFILNPEHPDFSEITIGDPQDFTFDGRLLKD